MKPTDYILCSECFNDEGLRLDSFKLGIENKNKCLNCGRTTGKKLDRELLETLVYRFFVKGTLLRLDYGAAPIIQVNSEAESEELNLQDHLKIDVKLIEEKVKLGFFYYGPREWMLGSITPLHMLQSVIERVEVIERIINEYPVKYIDQTDTFYRLRIKPQKPELDNEYDTPPKQNSGRLDDENFPVLYGSQDLEVCIHECRATVEDELYVASLAPIKKLKLLDLTELLPEENYAEDESLDMAIHMLFHAGKHSYEISRDIAKYIKLKDFDGIIYPSYFSTIRTGTTPFETHYGISIRKFPLYTEYAKSQVIPNIAIFGWPIKENKVKVKCINKIVLKQVKYDFHFGPVKY